jgi:hypothetical protein
LRPGRGMIRCAVPRHTPGVVHQDHLAARISRDSRRRNEWRSIRAADLRRFKVRQAFR